jgi:hypothetical protein
MSQKRTRYLKQAFNLTPSEWDQILAHQGGVCFICEQPTAHPHTDHRHRDGLVRGILCSSCNRGLGKIEDPRWKFTVHKLMRVIEYLMRPPASGALGRNVFGYAGKIGTKKYRAWVRKNKK